MAWRGTPSQRATTDSSRSGAPSAPCPSDGETHDGERGDDEDPDEDLAAARRGEDERKDAAGAEAGATGALLQRGRRGWIRISAAASPSAFMAG